MTTPFSKRFFGQIVHSGQNPTVTVPNGFIWVVRHMVCLTTAAGQTGPAVLLGSLAYLWTPPTSTPGITSFWEGRQVLNPADELLVSSGSSDAYYMISGYQLSAT